MAGRRSQSVHSYSQVGILLLLARACLLFVVDRWPCPYVGRIRLLAPIFLSALIPLSAHNRLMVLDGPLACVRLLVLCPSGGASGLATYPAPHSPAHKPVPPSLAQASLLASVRLLACVRLLAFVRLLACAHP
jgi:hypothetical protein